MSLARTMLRHFAIAGLTVSCAAFLLALMNLANAPPTDLHRLRDVSAAIFAFLLLALLASPAPRTEAERWVLKIRDAMNHPGAFWCLAISILLIYLIDAATQHLAFRTASHDFSMIDEALHTSFGGTPLFSPLLGRSFLSEHFSPILLLLPPIHHQFTSPWLLVLLQPIVLWSAVFPLRSLLRNHGGLERWQINLALVVFLNHPIMISTLEYLFHMECAIPLLVLTAVLCAERKQYFFYAMALLGALSIKEDMGIYLAGLGLFYLVRGKRPILGAATMLSGAAWTIFALKAAMPYFSPAGGAYAHISRWHSWGGDAAGIVAGFVEHPIRFASSLFNPAILLLFLSLAFLPLLKPGRGYWILFLFPWVVNATSDLENQAGLKFYYGVPILVFIVVGVVFALRDNAILWRSDSKPAAWIVVFLIAFNCCHFNLPAIPRQRAAILQGISEIHPRETVMASACFFPVLGYERKKILIRRDAIPSSSIILLKEGKGGWPLSPDETHEFAAICRREGYQLQWRHGDFVLMSKGSGP